MRTAQKVGLCGAVMVIVAGMASCGDEPTVVQSEGAQGAQVEPTADSTPVVDAGPRAAPLELATTVTLDPAGPVVFDMGLPEGFAVAPGGFRTGEKDVIPDAQLAGALSSEMAALEPSSPDSATQRADVERRISENSVAVPSHLARVQGSGMVDLDGRAAPDVIDLEIVEADVYSPDALELYFTDEWRAALEGTSSSRTVNGKPAVVLEEPGSLFQTTVMWQPQEGVSVGLYSRRLDPGWLLSVAEGMSFR